MTDKSRGDSTDGATEAPTRKALRAQRLASELRRNLLKRKNQMRARADEDDPSRAPRG